MAQKCESKLLGDKDNQTCRFCRKKKPETTFGNIAHAFPEFMGNKKLFSNYECNYCNSFFGNTIEKAAADFFLPNRAVLGVDGKGGNKQFRTIDGCLSFFNGLVNDKPHVITVAHSKDADKYIIEDSSKSLIISVPRLPHVPVAVYKCFVKMAITVMQENELSDFDDTVHWLLESEHRNFYADGRKLWLKVIYIPNAKNLNCPPYWFYKLTDTQSKKEHILFYTLWGGMCCGIEVPTSKNLNCLDITEFIDPYESKGYSFENIDLSSSLKTCSS